MGEAQMIVPPELYARLCVSQDMCIFYGDDPQLSLASPRLCDPKSREKQDLESFINMRNRENQLVCCHISSQGVFSVARSDVTFKFWDLILYFKKGHSSL